MQKANSVMQKAKIMTLETESEEEEFPIYEEPEEEKEMEEIENFHHSFFQPIDSLSILLENATFKWSKYKEINQNICGNARYAKTK